VKIRDGSLGMCSHQRFNGTALPPHCINAEQDHDESDVDCGGSCFACRQGSQCLGNSDCVGYTRLGDPVHNVCGSDRVCRSSKTLPTEKRVECSPSGSCPSDHYCNVPATKRERWHCFNDEKAYGGCLCQCSPSFLCTIDNRTALHTDVHCA
jgi:hypothetical protein